MEDRRADKTGFARDAIHLYKYMHIYLWTALRSKVLRIRNLRKRDLIADFRAGPLLVEVHGDVVSQPALAEALVNEAESVLTGPFVFWRTFDYLAVPHNLRLAEILKSRFETFKTF
jgi:hypothetical protein